MRLYSRTVTMYKAKSARHTARAWLIAVSLILEPYDHDREGYQQHVEYLQQSYADVVSVRTHLYLAFQIRYAENRAVRSDAVVYYIINYMEKQSGNDAQPSEGLIPLSLSPSLLRKVIGGSATGLPSLSAALMKSVIPGCGALSIALSEAS